jgi:hypothetical protein
MNIEAGRRKSDWGIGLCRCALGAYGGEKGKDWQSRPWLQRAGK